MTVLWTKVKKKLKFCKENLEHYEHSYDYQGKKKAIVKNRKAHLKLYVLK